MNVDVLEPPPPWWWYLPLALGTMSLTFSIWIVFKRNNDVRISLYYPVLPMKAARCIRLTGSYVPLAREQSGK